MDKEFPFIWVDSIIGELIKLDDKERKRMCKVLRRDLMDVSNGTHLMQFGIYETNPPDTP